ncbi:MAG TPA: site-specific DNA-methyltransferase [Ktedonobacteraceae bacterium]|jgi:DNA modification methylase|nr:site-specific DNA-methyltransferase [Ktedonobacteraceae bacterium]
MSDVGQDWQIRLFENDCLDVLRWLPSECVDLIVTSPPYADQRKHTYGGVHPDKYVEWFLPIAAELKRVLKQKGSFILNIKERVVDGERHTYVLELILALRKQGWLWTEEYIWHKRNSYPGKWPNRFRDAWERCLHFTKDKHFAMYQDAVRVPMGDWSQSRLRNLSETDRRRDNSRVQSGFGKKIENWVGRDMAYPDNVLHLATECSNQGHSATFPVELPSWFIKLLTQPGDVVLDPFLGSGTTAVAAKQLDRRCIGIEINPEYVRLAHERLAEVQRPISLFHLLNSEETIAKQTQQASSVSLFKEDTNTEEGNKAYESFGT